jgi:hypothetical protein
MASRDIHRPVGDTPSGSTGGDCRVVREIRHARRAAGGQGASDDRGYSILNAEKGVYFLL